MLHVYLESGRISILIITWFWITTWLQHDGAQFDKYNSKKKLSPDEDRARYEMLESALRTDSIFRLQTLYKRVQSSLERKYHISFVSLMRQIVPSRFFPLEEYINSVENVLHAIYCKHRIKRLLGNFKWLLHFLGV